MLMLRRFSNHAAPDPTPAVDELVAGALPDRVQTAHERLAHQDDPALLDALSERELAASRELAELVRDHERNEQRSRIHAAADAAERVRRTASALAEREAADLLRAAQAIGEQRRSSSPHAKVARLHQRKPRVLGLLAAVVAFAMLFSAVTVQQNIAPNGGMGNPMWWLSYGLEALISAVLVALMLSTGDTAEWGVIDRLWQVYTVEGVLLTASILLNTFPYIKAGDATGMGVHAIAPIMIGVALVTHRLVAERYGRAIEHATAAVPDNEDLQERLSALTQVGGAGNAILPNVLTGQSVAQTPAGSVVGDTEQGKPRSDPGSATAVVDGASDGPAAPEHSESAAQAGATNETGNAETSGGAEAAAANNVNAVSAATAESMMTELGLATIPTIAAVPANDPAAAEMGPAEADLDVRLASALRQTLARTRPMESEDPESVEEQSGSPRTGDAATQEVDGGRNGQARESEARTEPISAELGDSTVGQEPAGIPSATEETEYWAQTGEVPNANEGVAPLPGRAGNRGFDRPAAAVTDEPAEQPSDEHNAAVVDNGHGAVVYQRLPDTGDQPTGPVRFDKEPVLARGNGAPQ